MKAFHIVAVIVVFGAVAINGQAASRTQTANETLDRLKAASMSTATVTEFCTRPGTGRLGIVSMQKKFSDENLQASAEQFGRQLKFPVSFVRADGTLDIRVLERKMKALNLDIAVFVVDEESLPMSLVSLEERWGIINAWLILADNPSGKARELRLRRALARVFKALLCSGSTTKGVSAVRSGKDLEALPADPIDVASLMQMINSLQSFGLRPSRTVPYYRACMEGWAPAPTNDSQKAIWEKVHEIPDQPIKIKYQKPDQAQPAAK